MGERHLCKLEVAGSIPAGGSMARVRKDNKSWKASGIYKKDFQAQPEEAKHNSKKNTRKWCKGVVGVKHIYALYMQDVVCKMFFRHYKCEKCGKKFLRSK